MNKKYITGIVVVIIVLGLVAVFGNMGGLPAPSPVSNNPASSPTSNNPAPSTEQQTVKENVTGNIDDVAAAISADVASDNVPTADSDSTILSENDKALNDFGQSLDTQFQ